MADVALCSRCEMKRAGSSATIVYVPRPGATAEEELDVLANVYRFILDRHAKKMAAGPAPNPDSGDDVSITKGKEVSDVDYRPYKSSDIVLNYIREE